MKKCATTTCCNWPRGITRSYTPGTLRRFEPPEPYTLHPCPRAVDGGPPLHDDVSARCSARTGSQRALSLAVCGNSPATARTTSQRAACTTSWPSYNVPSAPQQRLALIRRQSKHSQPRCHQHHARLCSAPLELRRPFAAARFGGDFTS